MICIDYLIWIGNSYSGILCGRRNTCAIPFNISSSHCYMHEAEWRGCCRKVPTIPQSIIPGMSRIFLAHKDDCRRREQGRIFGYFILKEIEIIKGVTQSVDLPVQNIRKRITPYGSNTTAECWDGKRIVTNRLIDDKCNKLDPCSECHDGEEKKKICRDGMEITTHICENGQWVRTNEKCDDSTESEECQFGDVEITKCKNGQHIITQECMDGEWVKTEEEYDDNTEDKPDMEGQMKAVITNNGIRYVRIYKSGKWEDVDISQYIDNSPDQTMFEHERACSLRLKPGSIYFLDALASDITKSFQARLKKLKLKDKYLNSATLEDKEDILNEGRNLFLQVVQDVKGSRQTFTRIPDELTQHTELKGEFVYFKKKPKFERYPTAAFRGILNINGDTIIEKVAQGKEDIDIYYCKDSWQAKLSQAVRSNQAYIDRLIKHFIDICKTELNTNKEFVIPGFGKFYVVETKPRIGRNPATGKKIQIPAKKVVRFKPFKNLKESV